MFATFKNEQFYFFMNWFNAVIPDELPNGILSF